MWLKAYLRLAGFSFWLMILFTLVAFAHTIFFTLSTGMPFHPDISLTGGVSLSFTVPREVDFSRLRAILPDVIIRESVTPQGVLYTLESRNDSQDAIQQAVSLITQLTGLSEDDISIQLTGASLGKSFYAQLLRALLIAFIAMSLTVFFLFRIPLPSVYVIYAAVADMLGTLFIINLLNLPVSAAGIAAFLMLLGYSVDTDILLTKKLLQRKEGSLDERLRSAFTTGILMSVTSIAAALAGLLIAKHPVLDQIFLIILIGLVLDILNTWSVNAILLYRYVRARGEKQ